MARYPGAVWRPLDAAYVPSLRLVSHNRINHHVVAGYGSPWAYFNHGGRASCHFWVSKTGYVEQYIDTIMRAEADLHGNDATISIETESKGEAWTEAQLAAIIRLDAWLIANHGIPLKIASDSHIGSSSHGLSWHRLGINGNFPKGRYAGRIQNGGGMLYSTATGKTCPVEPVIDQIIDRVYPALIGGAVPIPTPEPTPTPTPKPLPTPEEAVMPYPRFFKIEGTNLAYEDLGDSRRRVSNPVYSRTLAQYEAGKVAIVAIPCNDSFFNLPIVEDDSYGEGYRKPGTEGVWVDAAAGGFHCRRWVDSPTYLKRGAFGILDLDAKHPFWSLPTTGPVPDKQ